MPNVLVTGGGFIGRHVIEELLRVGHEVTLLDRCAETRLHWPDGVSTCLGDIRDRDLVHDVVRAHDGVINLAGILGTAETIDNPFPSVATNIGGALNVLEACRPSNERPEGVRGVQISVGNHFMHNTYAITKSCAERFALMYNRDLGTHVPVVRALNAYGEHQRHEPVRKLVPNMIISALRRDPLRIYGDGEQVMDMIYVKDVARILVRAFDASEAPDDAVFEAGTGRPTTVNQIGALVNECAGSNAGCVHVPMRAGEPERAVVLADPTTLHPLGVVPDDLVALEDGMERTVRWFEQHHPWRE